MSSVNKVILIGHLGQDPEIRYAQSGDAIANISVATTESWKDKSSGEKKEQTEWHRVSAFGRLAEIIGEYLKKGSQVYIEGSLRTRKYTDKDGIERYATEIRAAEMRMLGAGPGQRQQPQQQPQRQQQRTQQQSRQQAPQRTQQQRPADDGFDDDIPFIKNVTLMTEQVVSSGLVRARGGRVTGGEF